MKSVILHQGDILKFFDRFMLNVCRFCSEMKNILLLCTKASLYSQISVLEQHFHNQIVASNIRSFI